jgi:hypothetical protein
MSKLTFEQAWVRLFHFCEEKPLGPHQTRLLNLIVECSGASVDEVHVATEVAFNDLSKHLERRDRIGTDELYVSEPLDRITYTQNAFYCLGAIKNEFKSRRNEATTSVEETI